MINIISLGAGVQSTTMALKAAHGEFLPMPDAAIFADTGAKPTHIYRHLDWLEKQLPFPVVRVMHKDGLRRNLEESLQGGRFAGAPFYTESDTGRAEGMLRRQCTREFKVQPIQQEVRRMLGLKKGQRAGNEVLATMWIGISTDEAQRMKPSEEKWIAKRYPLIDGAMSRMHCLQWMANHKYPKPSKSACTFCPYHDDAMWREMKQDDPESFADAVSIDRMIRGGVRGTTQRLYLHRSLKPLDEIDFRSAEDVGQQRLFDDECEGMCGV